MFMSLKGQAEWLKQKWGGTRVERSGRFRSMLGLVSFREGFIGCLLWNPLPDCTCPLTTAEDLCFSCVCNGRDAVSKPPMQSFAQSCSTSMWAYLQSKSRHGRPNWISWCLLIPAQPKWERTDAAAICICCWESTLSHLLLFKGGEKAAVSNECIWIGWDTHMLVVHGIRRGSWSDTWTTQTGLSSQTMTSLLMSTGPGPLLLLLSAVLLSLSGMVCAVSASSQLLLLWLIVYALHALPPPLSGPRPPHLGRRSHCGPCASFFHRHHPLFSPSYAVFARLFLSLSTFKMPCSMSLVLSLSLSMPAPLSLSAWWWLIYVAGLPLTLLP